MKRKLFLALLFSTLLSLSAVAQDRDPFDILVVGDSHISGQGLKRENRSYFLVKQWLDGEVFRGAVNVRLKVKAHAGSRLTLHPDEQKALAKAGDDVNRYHYEEANISTPSIRAQLEHARAEYEDPRSVRLVMLSGCITDVLVADIVNPFYPVKKLRERIGRFCRDSMADVLRYASELFPGAQIVAVGYFPIASTESDITTVLRYFLTVISLPRWLAPVFTNAVSRRLFKPLRNRIAARSRIWLEDSNKAIRAAVERVNSAYSHERVLFVESPIHAEQSYATRQSLFWEIGKDHLPNDETYRERKTNCARVFKELKYHHYGRLSTKMCELSSVAHLNVEGARVYAEAIKTAIAGRNATALRQTCSGIEGCLSREDHK